MQKYKNFFNQQTLIVPTPVDSKTKTTANNIEIDKIPIKSETI